MQDMRRHKRYRLDLVEINGKMSLADKVEIIDISIGGVALKTDRRLDPGREYMLRLGEKGKCIDVTGVIVRSTLSGIEERANNDNVTIYTVGMKFKEGSTEKITNFLKSIEHSNKEAPPAMADRRLNVRFHITTPGEKMLNFPAQFKVKEISLSGIRIHTDQSLAIESIIPMGLTLAGDDTVNFNGRVASCLRIEETGQALYEIGVEFLDLTDKDRTLLKTFIDYLVMREVNAKEEKTDT
jgi:hypothetical protein